jgi:hypothetical protein
VLRGEASCAARPKRELLPALCPLLPALCPLPEASRLLTVRSAALPQLLPLGCAAPAPEQATPCC